MFSSHPIRTRKRNRSVCVCHSNTMSNEPGVTTTCGCGLWVFKRHHLLLSRPLQQAPEYLMRHVNFPLQRRDVMTNCQRGKENERQREREKKREREGNSARVNHQPQVSIKCKWKSPHNESSHKELSSLQSQRCVNIKVNTSAIICQERYVAVRTTVTQIFIVYFCPVGSGRTLGGRPRAPQSFATCNVPTTVKFSNRCRHKRTTERKQGVKLKQKKEM